MADRFDRSALPPLRDVIATHALRAEKKLGQNFILDQNITDKIAAAAGDMSGATVFEIGPGPGGLTRSLLAAGADQVIAIEFDPRAVTALKDLETAAQGRLTVVQADALQTDLAALAPHARNRMIVANLPYNIASLLLINWLRRIRADTGAFSSMTLMFQREVANRLIATAGSKEYGRLSVMGQWLCGVKRLFDLPPSVFVPPPKIKSSVVRFMPHAPVRDAPSFESMETIVAAAFGQRRKMLRSSLKDYKSLLEKTGIDDSLRAEQLPVESFIRLAKATG